MSQNNVDKIKTKEPLTIRELIKKLQVIPGNTAADVFVDVDAYSNGVGFIYGVDVNPYGVQILVKADIKEWSDEPYF